MLPLFFTKKRKQEPLEALRSFICYHILAPSAEVDLVIKRENSIIMQLLRKYKNPSFNLRSPLNVQFVSSGTIEPGIDAGGPRREFFHMLMSELVRGSFNGIQIFEGEKGHLVPVNNYELLSTHFFEIVGKMVLHSLLNQCRGLEGISPAVATYIVSGNRDSVLEHLTIHDIPDPCLRNKLEEVSYSVKLSLCTFISAIVQVPTLLKYKFGQWVICTR